MIIFREDCCFLCWDCFFDTMQAFMMSDLIYFVTNTPVNLTSCCAYISALSWWKLYEKSSNIFENMVIFTKNWKKFMQPLLRNHRNGITRLLFHASILEVFQWENNDFLHYYNPWFLTRKLIWKLYPKPNSKSEIQMDT